MMTVQMTCPECESSIEVYPDKNAEKAQCDVCNHVVNVKFDDNHEQSVLKDCPCCGRKDFYQQKDFNRKIGVTLFIIASIASIWTYGVSFIVLYAADFFLFKKLRYVAVCYKCNTIFRGAKNINEIYGYDHEMNDRIIYADHDFGGKPLHSGH
jgi:hypothetical protein